MSRCYHYDELPIPAFHNLLGDKILLYTILEIPLLTVPKVPVIGSKNSTARCNKTKPNQKYQHGKHEVATVGKVGTLFIATCSAPQ